MTAWYGIYIGMRLLQWWNIYVMSWCHINVDIKLFKRFDSILYEWLSWCHINIDTALVQCSDNVILMWHHDVLSVLIQHCSSVFTKYSINIGHIMVTHWHWYNIVPVFLTKCHKNIDDNVMRHHLFWYIFFHSFITLIVHCINSMTQCHVNVSMTSRCG